MRCFPTVALCAPDVLLPAAGVDLAKWAVVACDQYTSEPEYWDEVEAIVGDAPSTLRLIFPEIYLEDDDKEARIAGIRAAMDDYLAREVLTAHEGMIYVERTVNARTRRGLVVAVDLEAYDYHRGAESLIRATEGTIVDRLPPRIAVRRGAAMELPHILVLIDDPEHTVMGSLSSDLEPAYDVELMMGGGRLSGYFVPESREAALVTALERLAGKFDSAPLLYAMGDGNHSLATAKAIWEELKAESAAPALMDDPRRYALVELINVHDEALVFEAIHRVLFDVAEGRDFLAELAEHFAGRITIEDTCPAGHMRTSVDGHDHPDLHRFGFVGPDGARVVTIGRRDANLAVGTLQGFLDRFMASGGAREIDYVHGWGPVVELGGRPGNVAMYLPSMSKHDLFATVIADGALPRKTFSMGEAREKRFYMECRGLALD